MTLAEYQRDFIAFAIEHGVLKFGEFTLKSGRTSPYFFNAGEFKTGAALAKLGGFYAAAIEASEVDYDLLFGPAYKGIPLVVATSIALATTHDTNVPYVFNRKEAKQHGEGGSLVGAALEGKVVIVDDVITAGTAIREVMDIIAATEAKPTAVVVAIDRQERGQGTTSAIQEVEADFDVKVISVVNLKQVIAYLEETNEAVELLDKMKAYQKTYGI